MKNQTTDNQFSENAKLMDNIDTDRGKSDQERERE